MADSALEGWCSESETFNDRASEGLMANCRIAIDDPPGTIDEVLALAPLTTVVSGGDFKADCLKWWTKALRLANVLGMGREDDGGSDSQIMDPISPNEPSLTQHEHLIAALEAEEERRRMFWLLYCMDRHLALSYNTPLNIIDASCRVFEPLPETTWQDLESHFATARSSRLYGPPTRIAGVGFFEYFLSLMAILGDIIDVHHRGSHPRFGKLENTLAISGIEDMLEECEADLKHLEGQTPVMDTGRNDFLHCAQPGSSSLQPDTANPQPLYALTRNQPENGGRHLAIAYNTHLLHVLHVLLHASGIPSPCSTMTRIGSRR